MVTLEMLVKLLEGFWHTLQSGQVPNLGFWNYVLLALFVFMEGPIVTLLAAAAASAGFLHVDLVFVAASTGNLSADTCWYLLGYTGKIEWLIRYGRWFGVRHHHLERLKQVMNKHATKILLVSKMTSAFIIPSLIAAGLAHVPWRRWFPSVLAGEMVWTGSLVLIGYYATQMIGRVEHDIRYLGVIGALIVLLVLLWAARRALQKRGEFDRLNNNDSEGEGTS
jgi:membrane protein DedA with SNARE-associated domain